MTGEWPSVSYGEWSATCDTLHAHTQVLGKLAVALAPAEPRLAHAALLLSARGWETRPLPAPDGSGALVVALDLCAHEAVAEHSNGSRRRIALGGDRAVGEVTRELLSAVRSLAGDVQIDPTPQEVPWSVPLDEDTEHHTYEQEHVTRYFAAATRASLVLAALRAPYRGCSTPVSAWWGSFDLAVSLFGADEEQELALGWWPGDPRHEEAAFYAYARPAQEAFAASAAALAPARWDSELGEYLLDWKDVRGSAHPHALALDFARSVFAHACDAGSWDPALRASIAGTPPA
jgi:hypothetical protein